MADEDKAKLAALRKKAQKKAAEAKKKAGGKAAAAPKEEDATAVDTGTDERATEAKEEETTADENIPAPTDESEAAPAAEDSQDAPAASTSDISALEAQLFELRKECAAAQSARGEAQLMADALEKKVASLEMLHTEDEGQIARLQTDLANLRVEAADLKAKLDNTEAENLRLSKRDAQEGGGANDGLDELEEEERQGLEKRIRELEAENADLRRGVWLEQRKSMQPAMEDLGGQFQNVDLSGGAMSPGAQRRQAGGLGDFFTSGLNALTGAGSQTPQGHGDDHAHANDEDGFLEDDDDFDEEAFRKAQEEAAKARIERIKEVKRSLKNWEGWRLDLVEGRRGGGEGIGEIFEV